MEGSVSSGEKEGAAGEAAGGGAGFRVRVSLEHFFSDERARAYMWVSPRRPVRSLARRLRRAHQLPRRLALLSRGHLLPPNEPLAVLRADDPVTVIPMSTESFCTDENSVKDDRRSEEGDAAGEAGGGGDGDGGGGGDDEGCDRVDAADSLADMKERALAMLHQYESALPPPPRRRARRRRPARRAAAAPAPPAGGAGQGAGQGEGVVLVGGGARAPRLVRALDPPAA